MQDVGGCDDGRDTGNDTEEALQSHNEDRLLQTDKDGAVILGESQFICH